MLGHIAMKRRFISPRELVSGILKDSAANLWGIKDCEFSVEAKNVPAFGDYSSNIAFALSPRLGKKPPEIAERIKTHLETAHADTVTKIDVAGGGFVNLFLARTVFERSCTHLAALSPKDFRTAHRQKIIVEFSSPNVAKPMHVGNLRATILGDFLARLHEFLGYRVIRWNHLGDWGTQFGKLIVAYRRWGEKKRIDSSPIEEMLALYVRFHREVKDDPGLEAEARTEFQKLEAKDKENTQLLEWFLDESLKDFNKLYRLLGVRFDVVKGESTYASDSTRVIKELTDAGMVQKSEGALIVPLEQEGLPPALIQKSDGSTLYMTREIASYQHRLKKFRPDVMLYVVGDEQALHFRQFAAVIKKIYAGRDVPAPEHTMFGLVLGPDKKKFATREGNMISAQEMVGEILVRAHRVVAEKQPQLSEAERNAIANETGVGALKYNLLKDSRFSAVVFDPDTALALSGNSGPYLQYTFARFSKILTKASRVGKANVSTLEASDIELVKKLTAFPDALEASRADRSPHHLATYLFELATLANGFYESTPILKDINVPRRNARLELIRALCTTMSMGLEILGIKALSAL